ncbi:hypothetical protein RM533_10045 [Croceicoccus sp. F390]|uniref:Uncharacterized protein n=1 Tax=Croceicoccus esteveae TaxID=3075597 RepID=A0ABU2ZKF1_9SPHN|nr:hypothetical protein [Croceicoccus sp. F390]MDT0576528.1 hypothetical protein [Croceicoccus sp. F390]
MISAGSRFDWAALARAAAQRVARQARPVAHASRDFRDDPCRWRQAEWLWPQFTSDRKD